jgi:hypothetical protein
MRERGIASGTEETHMTVDQDTGEIAVGVSPIIRKASWCSWRDGNPDPDERRKHDSLLERYYYRGPYWEKRRQGWLPQETVDLWKGPTLSEALLHRDKYDIGVDVPTPKLDDHPDLKGHMLDMALRNDCVGVFDEPDVEAMHVKAKEKITGEALGEGAMRMFLTSEKDKADGSPSVTEFLRGRREH